MTVKLFATVSLLVLAALAVVSFAANIAPLPDCWPCPKKPPVTQHIAI